MAEKPTATTMEKLFVQIFERKRWIVDQVRHQSRLFDHHLASTLLIDGIPPPPWLLPHPSLADAESKKEELISGLLFPYPQASVPYSSSHRSVSHRLNFAADAEVLRGLYGDARPTHGKPETGADATVMPKVVSAPACASDPPLSLLAHECVSNDAPEPMPTPVNVVKSLGEQSEAVVPDSYHSIEQSLARIQRSKSRQKDIELRSSTKANRAILHHEGNATEIAGTVICSGSVRPLIGQVDDMELVIPSSPGRDVVAVAEYQNVDCQDDMELVVPSGNDCDVLAVEEDRNVDCRSQDEGIRISSVRGEETFVSGLQPLSVSESIKFERSHSIAGNSDSQVSASLVKLDSGASGLVQLSSASDGAGEKRMQEGNSIYSTEPHREIEFPELVGLSGVNCEADLSIEEAIHDNSTEQPHEISRLREAETELCQIPEKLDGGRPSGLPESGDIGSLNLQVKNTGGMSLQLQQVDGSGGQLIQPLKQGILFSSGQPSSTALHSIASGQPSTIADQMDVISCNRYGAHSKSIDTNAEKMQDISDKPSRSFSAHIQSDLDNDHLKHDAEILVSRSSTDRSVHVKPKQLNFNYLAGQTNSPNKLEGTAFKVPVQEEVPSDCQIKSLDRENENGQCLLFPNEGEPDDGSSNGISEVAELVCDAAEAGKSLSTEFSSGRETDKSRFSVPQNKITHLFYGQNALKRPLYVDEGSNLCSLNSLEKGVLSVGGNTDKLDSVNQSILGSHPSKPEYCMSAGPGSSTEVRVREVDSSSMSSPPNLSLRDRAAAIGTNMQQSNGDMFVDNPACQSDNPEDNRNSSLLDEVGFKLDDHQLSGKSSRSGEKLCSQSRGRSAEAGQNVAVTASLSSFFPSSHRDCSAKSHQMDVQGPKEIIIAYEGDPVSPNASCNPVDSDDQILEDYAVEGFRFTPTELETQGDPGPSLQTGMLRENPAVPLISFSAETEVTGPPGHVLDQSKASVEENRDHPHPEDHISNGDAEQSASSEGPMDGKRSHLEESYEPSSHLASSPCLQVESTDADHDMPIFEGFTMPSGEENLCLPKGQSSFEKLDLRDPIVERACFIEQLCKSTCMDTPFSYSSTADKLQKESDLYQSVPNGLLEYIDLKNSRPLDDDTFGLYNGDFFKKEAKHALDGRSFSDTLPLSGSGNGRKPYSSPVGKLWDRMASSSGSSKKKASLNPELPCISEENEIADEVIGTSGKDASLPVITSSAKRKPLDDITEDPNLHVSVSELENHRCSLESVNTEVSFSGTNKRYKQETGMRRMRKSRLTNNIRDSKPLVSCVRVAKMPLEPPHNSASKRNTSLKKDGLNILEKEVKRGNIVCNVNSFIPLVQQKQAVKPATGKRDVKVKALEAADAARRQLEKREVERKMKKEAMQLERARVEQENKRQLELQLKKKEEDRKKKEAEIAARKRLREEDEKREKERKRRRVEEARRQQEEQKGKARLKKDDKGTKTKAMVPGEARDAGPKKSENVADFVQSLHAMAERGSFVPETPRVCPDNSKEASFFSQGEVEAAVGDIQEQSYEISPFQCSDDEYNEDDDDKPKKFIPSWASKHQLAQAIAAQQKVDPNLILPPESFCSIAEVVLPRSMKLR